MNAEKVIECANCNKVGEQNLYAHDSRFGLTLSYFCRDCWVIVYGEGTHILQEAKD